MVGLDPKSSYTLKQEMVRYAKEGNTVFFSTHVLEVAQEVCTRVGIIDRGKLRFDGTLEELRQGTDRSLEDLFLSLTEETNG
jgi:ABC-2 type transport system ATP-binding protein